MKDQLGYSFTTRFKSDRFKLDSAFLMSFSLRMKLGLPSTSASACFGFPSLLTSSSSRIATTIRASSSKSSSLYLQSISGMGAYAGSSMFKQRVQASRTFRRGLGTFPADKGLVIDQDPKEINAAVKLLLSDPNALALLVGEMDSNPVFARSLVLQVKISQIPVAVTLDTRGLRRRRRR